MPVDLRGILGSAQRDLQRTMNLVSLGLQAAAEVPDFPMEIPNLTFRWEFDSYQNWTPDQKVNEWKRWILINGFRDAAEVVNAVLEEVQSVLAGSSLDPQPDDNSSVPADAWNRPTPDRRREFNALFLPHKIQFLKSKYALSFDEKLVEEVISINKTRNCLVHRSGVVNERDTTEGSKLILHWTAPVLLLEKDGVQKEVLPPFEGATTVTLTWRSRVKEFSLGQVIEINSTEFAQICWSLFLFARHCWEVVAARGRAMGVKFNESSSA